MFTLLVSQLYKLRNIYRQFLYDYNLLHSLLTPFL